jgi:GH35 family endo-1,4-beta-xylanase
MAVMGYSIGAMYARGDQFYWATPQWIQALVFPDAIQALLLYHIEKDVRYTKGKNPIWLLFNESILDNFDGQGARLRNRQQAGADYSPWAANKSDTSLIKAAFTKAREVDPGATLILNDEPDADIGAEKSEYEYALVSELKKEGTPIDGVGFELHNFIDPSGKLALWRTQNQYVYQNNTFVDMDTFLNNVDLNVKRYASIGMKVALTEIEGQIKIGDIDFTTPAGKAEYDKRLQWQAKYYAGLLKIALDNENVIMFHSWGITDRYQGATVWPGFGNGFIFDKNYNPKPGYYAMLDELKNYK